MLIAKLRVSMNDAGILYNNSADLTTDKTRGTVLPDGKVVRGLGTSFKSAEAKARYDKLVAEANSIRADFGTRFLRTPIQSTFVINKAGEGKEYVKKFQGNPDIEVSVFEFELGAQDNLDAKEMKEWGDRVKEQLRRVPLGRGEEADAEGLSALETLAGCPVLSQETAARVRLMVSEVRVGKMTRTDLKRGIALLDVQLDQSSLLAPRSRPEPVA